MKIRVETLSNRVKDEMIKGAEGKKKTKKTDEVRFWRGDREKMSDPEGSEKERGSGGTTPLSDHLSFTRSPPPPSQRCSTRIPSHGTRSLALTCAFVFTLTDTNIVAMHKKMSLLPLSLHPPASLTAFLLLKLF